MTIIKKFEPDEIVKSKFPKFWAGVATVSLLILVSIEIWVNNSTVEYGAKFEKSEALERALDLENQILENEIAKQVSLSSISSKSAELGFSKPSSVQYIR